MFNFSPSSSSTAPDLQFSALRVNPKLHRIATDPDSRFLSFFLSTFISFNKNEISDRQGRRWQDHRQNDKRDFLKQDFLDTGGKWEQLDTEFRKSFCKLQNPLRATGPLNIWFCGLLIGFQWQILKVLPSLILLCPSYGRHAVFSCSLFEYRIELLLLIIRLLQNNWSCFVGLKATFGQSISVILICIYNYSIY